MRNVVRWIALPALLCSLDLSCTQGDDRQDEGTILPVLSVPGETARVLAFGDWGDGGEAQKAVAAGIVAREETAPFDFALLLGDNFYERGVETPESPLFNAYFRAIYPADSLNFPFYVILGNHDHYGRPRAQFRYVDPDGRWKAPGFAYLLPVVLSDGYAVDIYGLDSALLVDAAENPWPGREGQTIRDWALRMMRSRSPDLCILAVHHPPFSSGDHGDNPVLFDFLAEMFTEGYVDVVLSGHDHDLELQELDVDGDASQELFVVSGAACRLRAVGKSAATAFSASTFGFAELEISASATTVSFFDSTNALLYRR